MEFSSRGEGGCTVVEVKGRLDAASTPDFDAFCRSLTGAPGCRMLIDLAGLEYVSSIGLRSLLAVAKELQRSGGGLALARATGLVKTVLTVSGFDSLIPVEETVEAALARLG